MIKVFTRFGLAVLALAVLAIAALSLTSSASAMGAYAGHVYTETNAASGNSLLVYGRALDGTLTYLATYPTGGLGSGSGLGSQGALARSADGRYLLAVNAGSNDISVISASDGSIAFRGASGGLTPVSITTFSNRVYVLNAGGSGNISGFTIDHSGQLAPIANSTQPLSSASAGPAEVAFSPNGRILVVTEKATSMIDTYTVNDDGSANAPVSYPSSGAVPFGFDFGRNNNLLVSEAAASAASSYHVTNDGTLTLRTGTVVNGQLAACWLVVTRNGRYAYTADAHNGMISSYAVSPDGNLTLIDGTAGTPGGAPLDEATSRGDKFLYVLNPHDGVLNIFGIGADGSLTQQVGMGGVPASAAGLIAR